MNIDSWCIERLKTTNAEYCTLKQAGINTFGEAKNILGGDTDAAVANTHLTKTSIQKILKQIGDFELQEELAEQQAAEKQAAELARAQRRAERQARKERPPALDELPRLPHTIEELETYHAETITPEIAANIIGCSAQSIRSQAQVDAGALGFPVIVMGTRVHIPRRGFIYFMRYGRTCIQKRGGE